MYFEANEGNRAEPLEGISKFHSIWISHGELRGQELSCEKCTISDRCVQCDETVTKKKEEKKKFKCTYCPKMYVHLKKHSISTFLPINKFLLTTVINFLFLYL